VPELSQEGQVDADERSEMNDDPSNHDAEGSKEAIVEQIFIAYKEAAALYRKTTNPASRETLREIRHGFDVILQHFFPLGEESEKRWDEFRAGFSD